MTAHRSDRKGVNPPGESGEACPWACVSPRKTSVHRRHGHPVHRRLSSARPPRVHTDQLLQLLHHTPTLASAPMDCPNALIIVSSFMLNILDGIGETLQAHTHGYRTRPHNWDKAVHTGTVRGECPQNGSG